MDAKIVTRKATLRFSVSRMLLPLTSCMPVHYCSPQKVGQPRADKKNRNDRRLTNQQSGKKAVEDEQVTLLSYDSGSNVLKRVVYMQHRRMAILLKQIKIALHSVVRMHYCAH